jgi:hypothetical protein
MSLTGLRVGAAGAVVVVGNVMGVNGNVITTGAGWNAHWADGGKAYIAILEGGQYNKAGRELEEDGRG